MSLAVQIAALETLTPKELKSRYYQVFGEQARSGNKRWLVKRIAWRIQQKALGGLPERALNRIEQLADEAEIRSIPPKELAQRAENIHSARKATVSGSADPRIPPPGSIIRRRYHGRNYTVTVTADGFVLDGSTYKSLSAVAREITGTRWNGFAFFNLKGDAK